MPPILRYEFGKLDNGEHVGWSDPVATIFSHISRTLVRETMQNVIDNPVIFPTIIEFSCSTMPARSFIPSPDKLIKIYEACAEEVKTHKHAKEHFEQAAEILRRNENIKILKISDYNTTGLVGGDREPGKNFMAFMHAVGMGNTVAGAGGHFGLGKGSLYASSGLRAIFVVSKTATDHIFQGKLRLVTHTLDGIEFQDTGSFGLERQRPLRGIDGLPSPMFKRDKVGTDIYVPAYLGGDNWTDMIIQAALSYFWLAIYRDKIIVKVNGTSINKDNLQEMMVKYFPIGAGGDSPAFFLRAFTDTDNHKFFYEDLESLGRVELYVLLGQGYPSRVEYFRSTGMQIQTIGHRLPKDYAGVFVCDDTDDADGTNGNEILKFMENATHDEWDPENARTYGPEVEKKCKQANTELRNFVRKSLDTLIDISGGESIYIPGVEELLGMPVEGEVKKGGEVGQENVFLDTDTSITPISIRKRTIKPKGRRNYISVPVIAKSFPTLKKDIMKYNIILSGEPGLKIDLLDIAVGTETGSDSKKISSVYLEGKKIKIADVSSVRDVKLNPKGHASLAVDFGDSEKYSLRVTAYKKLKAEK